MGRARGGLMGVHGHPPLCMLRYEDASAEKWLRWPAPCQTELVQERLWPRLGCKLACSPPRLAVQHHQWIDGALPRTEGPEGPWRPRAEGPWRPLGARGQRGPWIDA